MEPTYGQRLRAARKAAGLTLRELGERCAVDFTSLSHLEHGRFIPSYALGRRLTDALGVDLLPPRKLTQAHARIAELEEALLTRHVWLNIWHLEALRRIHPDDPVPRPTVEDYDEARRQLREAGLL